MAKITDTAVYTGKYTTFSITVGGEYDVQVTGAQGGAGFGAGATGGMGAAVGGDIYLTAGTRLLLLAGGAGQAAPHFGGVGGGGGGGSYFV